MFTRVDLGAWSLLLIALGVAYFVGVKASKEGSKLFKYGGYVMSVIILVVSLILVITDIGNRIKRQSRRLPTRTDVTAPRPRIPEVPRFPKKAVGIPESEKAAPETTR